MVRPEVGKRDCVGRTREEDRANFRELNYTLRARIQVLGSATARRLLLFKIMTQNSSWGHSRLFYIYEFAKISYVYELNF